MVWKIEYLKSIQKDVRKIDRTSQKKIKEYLEGKVANMENPRDIGKALKGEMKELWRYRIGDYRAICEIQDKTITVLVIHIGHRKNVYKKQN